MLKSLPFNKNFPAWFLIGWQHNLMRPEVSFENFVPIIIYIIIYIHNS